MSNSDQAAFLSQLWLMTMYIADGTFEKVMAFIMFAVFLWIAYREDRK